MKSTGRTVAGIGLMLLTSLVIVVAKLSAHDAHAAAPPMDYGYAAPAMECAADDAYFAESTAQLDTGRDRDLYGSREDRSAEDVPSVPAGFGSPTPPPDTETPTNTPPPRTRTPTRTPVAAVRSRMTGGGHVSDGSVKRDVSHGFQLRCDATDRHQNLEINWAGGNKWHLETLTSANCIDDPLLDECPPCAGFDTFIGSAVGRYNGQPGATADFTFTDDGEPGTGDHVDIVIRDSGGSIVLAVSGYLDGGDHQAHRR